MITILVLLYTPIYSFAIIFLFGRGWGPNSIAKSDGSLISPLDPPLDSALNCTMVCCSLWNY